MKTLLALLLTVCIISCSKPNDNNDGNPVVPPVHNTDSADVLAGYLDFAFDYNHDTLPYVASRTVRYLPIDSLFIYYNSEKRVSRVFLKEINEITSYSIDTLYKSVIFLYANNKISKILKRPTIEAYQLSTDYQTSTGQYLYEGTSCDSLIYSGEQLVKVCHVDPAGRINSYETISYQKDYPTLIEYVDSYIANGPVGNFDKIDSMWIHSYDIGKVNPIYPVFKEIGFVFNTHVLPWPGYLGTYVNLNPFVAASARLRWTDYRGGQYTDATFTNRYNSNNQLIETKAPSRNYTGITIQFKYKRIPLHP